MAELKTTTIYGDLIVKNKLIVYGDLHIEGDLYINGVKVEIVQ